MCSGDRPEERCRSISRCRCDWRAMAIPDVTAIRATTPPQRNMLGRAPKWSISQPTRRSADRLPTEQHQDVDTHHPSADASGRAGLHQGVGPGQEQQGQQPGRHQHGAEQPAERGQRRQHQDRPEAGEDAHQRPQPQRLGPAGGQDRAGQGTQGGQRVEQAVAADPGPELVVGERRQDHRHVEPEHPDGGHQHDRPGHLGGVPDVAQSLPQLSLGARRRPRPAHRSAAG